MTTLLAATAPIGRLLAGAEEGCGTAHERVAGLPAGTIAGELAAT